MQYLIKCLVSCVLALYHRLENFLLFKSNFCPLFAFGEREGSLGKVLLKSWNNLLTIALKKVLIFFRKGTFSLLFFFQSNDFSVFPFSHSSRISKASPNLLLSQTFFKTLDCFSFSGFCLRKVRIFVTQKKGTEMPKYELHYILEEKCIYSSMYLVHFYVTHQKTNSSGVQSGSSSAKSN